MKPSEVFLNGGKGYPFPETFGDVGLEIAVAMIVCACAMYEDRWQPVTIPMIGVAVKRNLRANREPWSSLNVNRAAANPKFYELAERGIARFTQSDRSRSPIELTERTLDILRERWWRPEDAAKSHAFERRVLEIQGHSEKPYEPPTITDVTSEDESS